jgi:hypothetical protein
MQMRFHGQRPRRIASVCLGSVFTPNGLNKERVDQNEVG